MSLDKRHKIFFIAAAAFFLLITARMALLASSYGEKFRKEAAALSVYRGELAAARGRIFDVNGELIVWSERCYDLVFTGGKSNRSEYKKLCEALKKHFPDITLPDTVRQKKVVLKTDLNASELEIADKLSSDFAALQTVLRWKRHVKKYPQQIGTVKSVNGQEVGVSGLEKKFDQHLSGTPSEFTVILDRHGKWVPSTFKITRLGQDGKDLYLTESLENINYENAQ